MLILYNNNIDDETYLVLAGAIRNNTRIIDLYLADKKIGDKGVKAIFDALSNNHSLEILGLNNYQIYVEGAIAISDILKISVDDNCNSKGALLGVSGACVT